MFANEMSFPFTRVCVHVPQMFLFSLLVTKGLSFRRLVLTVNFNRLNVICPFSLGLDAVKVEAVVRPRKRQRETERDRERQRKTERETKRETEGYEEEHSITNRFGKKKKTR